MDKVTLQTLLEQIAEGDEAAFRDLFDSYKQKVFAYAMHFTHSTESSEEIVQDIFLKIWLKREHLTETNNFEAYLYTVTRNLCFDYLKKLANDYALKRALVRHTVQTEQDPENIYQFRHYESLVRQAVNQLPPQQKKIYTLSLYEGQKQEEIAESLHISKNTVKVHLAKARATVRSFLIIHLSVIILLLMISLKDLL